MPMSHFRKYLGAYLVGALAVVATPALVQTNEDARGEYLARIMDCGGCHTPGALAGKPDEGRALAGSRIGFHSPDLGYFYPPNLTPDQQTGLGAWSQADIVRAVRTGVRPDGRVLAPVMPWHSYRALSDADAQALARYLKNLAPVHHRVPSLAGPRATPDYPYLSVVTPKR
jgi:mono/diheme cytochrome c family protein